MGNVGQVHLMSILLCIISSAAFPVSLEVTVVIDGYTVDSTQSSPASLPLGTALVLLCRVSGIPQRQIKYNWTCPDGPCERPGHVGRKVVNDNILAVNITSKSDGGTYTCEVSGEEADGGYNQNYTLNISEGNIIHSYGRLFHREHVITRGDQLLPPGDGTEPGRLDCIRIVPETARFDVAFVGGPPPNNLVNQSDGGDEQMATLFLNRSYLSMNTFKNVEGSCGTYFYLYLIPGTLSNVTIMSAMSSTTDARIVLNNIPLDIGRVIVGYERHDLGVTLQGEHANIWKRTQHTFSSLVPGARYTVVVQGLSASVGDRSQQVTRVDFKTIETEPSAPRHSHIIRVHRNGIVLNWIPPLEPNGDIYYLVAYNDGNRTVSLKTSSESTYFNLTGLQRGVTYNITVVAVNSAGRSDTGAVLNYTHNLQSSPETTVVIDGYTIDSTQSSPASLPLGTALVLVCRVSGIPQRQIKYNWTCPDGPCEHSGSVGRKVVNGNILAVNITSDSDGGTYTCEVSGDEKDGGYRQNYTLKISGGHVIHSYGRLVHHEHVITRGDQLLTPGDGTGPGRMECIRTAPETAHFDVVFVGGQQPNNLVNQSDGDDEQMATLFFDRSYLSMNTFKNTEGSCGTYFYLYLIPGKLPNVTIMSVVPRTTDARIVLNNILSDIGRVNVGYERHDLGVTLQGEYANIGRRTQHTFSSLVPGARYTVVVQGLTAAAGDRSEHVTREDVKTEEKEPSAPRNPCIIADDTDGIELNWIPPLEPNGDVYYLIEYNDGNKTASVNTSSESTYFSLTGLQRGVTYYITVVAVNSAGSSDTGPVLNYTHTLLISTPQPAPNNPDGEHVNSTNAAAIIASLLAVLLVIITFSLILGVVLLKYWRKKKNKDTVFIMKKNHPSRAVYNHPEDYNIHIQPVESATLSDWEMTHSHLELQGDLGKGQFGDVKLAYLKTITCTRRVRNYMDRMIKLGYSMSTLNTVAVKYLKGTATCESKASFLEEIELMKKVSTTSNNHIVQLIGYVLLEEPMAMVMEYIPFGDLHSNLIKWKEQIGELSMSSTQLNSDDTTGQNYLYSKETLKDQDIFSYAYQIAKGMKYLATMNVIHRDLACRNVLVGENKTLKISDFGLSKEIDGVYASSSRTRLPIRWMAPEAITHRLFSEKSDIWSYGVCLWEICTLGEVPYGHLPNAEVARAIVKSILLERPSTCHDKIHELMLRCWRMRASNRPTFTDIKAYLEGLIEEECGSMYIMLENDYEGEKDNLTGEEMPEDVESI